MNHNLLVGQSGGPTAVINGSLYGVVSEGLANPEIDNVIGMVNGIEGFLADHTIDMAPLKENGELERIRTTPGSYLGSCRYKLPEDLSDPVYPELFQKFTEKEISYFFYIGGNDSMDTVSKLSRYAATVGSDIRIIGVPKTIDNDLPLPDCAPTFGYESAKDKGAVIARAVYVDARTSGNWFVMSAMGRSAGHLAFGIGEACHYPMIVIPEMFNKTPITIDKIIRLMVSSIVKRRIVSMDYGAAVISEGVFHELSEAELSSCGIHFTYDAHGHPELGKVSKACFFSMLLDQRLAELKLNVQTRPVELGYEIRGQTPVAYDLTYCSELGIGVYKLFSEGKTGCMVYVDGCGNVEPLYLKDLQDPATGKILPRMVDISSDRFKAVVDNILMAITPPDYEAARQYLSNPEEYDFCKILGWDETDL